jgi:hypothetical protein
MLTTWRLAWKGAFKARALILIHVSLLQSEVDIARSIHGAGIVHSVRETSFLQLNPVVQPRRILWVLLDYWRLHQRSQVRSWDVR